MGWIGRLCLKIERKINNINLQKKFLFSYIFIITLIFVLGISLSYFNISKFYIQQVKDVSEDAFLQAKDSLESLVENNLYAAYIVQNSDEIQSIFTQEEKDLMSQYEDMRKIQKYIFNINAPLSIFRITIYVSDDLVYSNYNLYYSKIRELYEYEVFKTFVESSDVYIWMPTEYI
ncbi:MAG: hypothetical protein LUI07_01105, partial [Lachnospiraceae bacterium]|nr:hypothetical protein [Lachnospiraceae bacterium]